MIPLGLLFWIIMIVWLIVAWMYQWPVAATSRIAYAPFGGSVLIFILFVIIGVHLWGWPFAGR